MGIVMRVMRKDLMRRHWDDCAASYRENSKDAARNHIDRPLGIYKGTQEVLAGSDHSCFTNSGCAASLRAKFGGCTVYLYVVLSVMITYLFSRFIIFDWY